MSVNKIVTKVDGTINKTIDFNDLKAGLGAGAHTITVEAWNGAELISTQTKNITIAAAGDEAETTSYINRVNTDTGVVINEAYIDTVYKQLKTDASLANLLFWMDAKGGMKKDASNFISKTYDLSSSLNDPTQLTGSKQPLFSTNIVFDGSSDALNSSLLTMSVGTTLYAKIIPEAFGGVFLGKTGDDNVYLQLKTSTDIRLKGVTDVLIWTVPTMTIGTAYDLFIRRTSAGYTLFLNGASQGEKATTDLFEFTILGNYNTSGFAFTGGFQKLALFNEILTPTKMNNLIAL